MTRFGGILYSKPKPLPLPPDEVPYSFIDRTTGITFIYTYKNAISSDDYTTIYFGEAYVSNKKIDDVVIKRVSENNYVEYGQLMNEHLKFILTLRHRIHMDRITH